MYKSNYSLKTHKLIFSWLARFIASLVCVISSATIAAPSDLSGEGKSDLIFRNNSTGEINAWLMNSGAATSTAQLVGPGNWTVSHTADFNGDGKADILYRNDDGTVGVWLMNGLASISQTTLLGANPDWRVTHVGDFNGDGKADLLWQNTNGAVTIWLMNGSTVVSAVGVLGANPEWSVTHIADFNGDGKADLLWRSTTGAVTIWLMNGGSAISAAGLLGPTSVWRVSHTADLNGDGKADLLWRSTDGTVTTWLMNGTSAISSAALLGANPDWSVSHTPDFNGDGKSDLLWRNTNGAVSIWQMNGLTNTGAVGLLGADANWRVTHIGDYNGDGRADVVWRNAADGSVAMWLIDGATVLSKTTILGANPWVVMPLSGSEPVLRKIFGTADNCVDDFIATNPQSDAYNDRSTAVVGYWGDAGTAELNFQVSNPVTWNVEALLNMPNPTKKLGYWNLGSPVGTSAVVLKCNEVGFLLNTFQFSHTQSLVGGGPQGQLKKKVSMPKKIFTSSQSDLIIQGYVKQPFHHWAESDAAGQISIYYYVQPIYCPDYTGGLCPAAALTNSIPAFAHLMGIYESRLPNGYGESFGSDTFTGFFSGPLLDQLPDGTAPKYVKKSQYSSAYSGGSSTWSESRFFRGEISFARMQAMINTVRAASSTIAEKTSDDPSKWGIVLVGGLLEAFPNTNATDGSPCIRNTNKVGCRDISIATTFSSIEAYERIPAVGGFQPNTALAATSQEVKADMPSVLSRPLVTAPEFSAERARALLR